MQWLIERYLAKQLERMIKNEILLQFCCNCEVSMRKVNKSYWELMVRTVSANRNKQIIQKKGKSAKNILTFIINYNSLVSEIITSLGDE